MTTSQPVSRAATAAPLLPIVDPIPASATPIAGTLHTVALLAFLGLWAYFGRENAIRMRAQPAPNHLLMYFRTIFVEWTVCGYILWGIRKRGISVKELVGPRWSKGKESLTDFGIAAAFEVASITVLAFVSLALRTGSNAQNVRFMTPVGPFEIGVWILLSFTAGICEETIFRGYLQKQFIGWTGNAAVGILISAICFGTVHIYQGYKQAVSIGLLGAMLGVVALLRRSLKPGMIAHSFQDAIVGISFSLLGR
jgi:membrane protease YdiL (CAAX protease family)